MTRSSLCAVLSALVLGSCSSSSGPPRQHPAPPVAVGGNVVATVDGVPITRADVELATSAAPAPHAGAQPASPAALLEHIIQQELLARRAVAAGLDRDPEYRQELARREAQLAAWKRGELSELYERREASRRAPVSEADARRYYDENGARIRTEVRVAQILMRDEARIDQALRDLRAGTSFDEVAARQFPAVHDLVNKPWELDFLRWHQLPEPWRPVIDAIAVGQTSEVIRGANNRFWIIKVLERRENSAFTFEATQALITTQLQDQRRVESLSRLHDEARRTAHIVYARPPRVSGTPTKTP